MLAHRSHPMPTGSLRAEMLRTLTGEHLVRSYEAVAAYNFYDLGVKPLLRTALAVREPTFNGCLSYS